MFSRASLRRALAACLIVLVAGAVLQIEGVIPIRVIEALYLTEIGSAAGAVAIGIVLIATL